MRLSQLKQGAYVDLKLRSLLTALDRVGKLLRPWARNRSAEMYIAPLLELVGETHDTLAERLEQWAKQQVVPSDTATAKANDPTELQPEDTFDPGAPGQESAAHRWAQRTLQQTARTYHLTKPGMRTFAKQVLQLAQNPQVMAVEPLTPAEAKDLWRKFVREPQP